MAVAKTERRVPTMYCKCGCGERTTVAPKTDNAKGWKGGVPVDFRPGHNLRRTAEAYRVDDNGCWVWIRYVMPNGYGRLNRRLAHKVMWEQAHGPVPEGLELDHLCRNRACVNPAHLEAVTRAENQRRGAGAKLTADEVRSIRASTSSQADLARRFGVSPGHVWQILHRMKWRDLDVVEA